MKGFKNMINKEYVVSIQDNGWLLYHSNGKPTRMVLIGESKAALRGVIDKYNSDGANLDNDCYSIKNTQQIFYLKE